MAPGIKAFPVIRMVTGKSGPTASLTLLMTARGNRHLFSQLPPYSSSRRLVVGERNWQIRYPAEPSISTASKPAFLARTAASAHFSSTSWISATVMARGVSLV